MYYVFTLPKLCNAQYQGLSDKSVRIDNNLLNARPMARALRCRKFAVSPHLSEHVSK